MNSSEPRPRHAIVIGGGPAGLMAADVLATAGWSVDVHDRMPTVGRKFLMAGRGGLNLTHSEPLEAFLTRFGDLPAPVRAAIEAFPPQAVINWAESLGEATFVGSSGRVFPKSMKASPLLRAWLRRLDGLGVRFHQRSRWLGWDDAGLPMFESASGERTGTHADAMILALGGGSWGRLGSDGAWVPVLSGAGVAVAPLVASNVGVRIGWSELFAAKSAGEPLKRITATVGDMTVAGEAIITKDGLEGGVIYALGTAIRAGLAAGPVALTLDLRPDVASAEIVKALAKARKGDTVSNILRKTGLSAAAIGVLREAHGRALPDNPYALAAAIKSAPLTINGLQPIARAISSAGGVAASAIDADFGLMARPDVFVAGEMLDWDAPTGGYLLTATLATAVAAAKGALRLTRTEFPA